MTKLASDARPEARRTAALRSPRALAAAVRHKARVIAWRRRRSRTPAARLLFAEDWYATRYGVGRARAYRHYLRVGWRALHAPAPWLDPSWYSATYQLPPDVNPLEHFASEPGRHRPNRWFDPAIWARVRGHDDIVRFLSTLPVRAEAPEIVLAGDGKHVLADAVDLCVYAHYDPDGLVDPYVTTVVEALAGAGLTVVVCSACDTLEPTGLRALLPHAAHVLTTGNTGYDWGSYREGLRFASVRCAPRSVTFVNDSVYPVGDVGALVRELRRVDADLVGATSSLELRPHLQSFALHVRSTDVCRELLRELRETFIHIPDRDYVVAAYEVGLSRRAEELGLRLGAVFDASELVGTAGAPLHPASDRWQELLRAGFPFLKVSVVRERGDELVALPSLTDRQALARVRRHAERLGVAVPWP